MNNVFHSLPPFLLVLPGLALHPIPQFRQPPSLPTFPFFLTPVSSTWPLPFLHTMGLERVNLCLQKRIQTLLPSTKKPFTTWHPSKPPIYILHEPRETSLSAMCYCEHSLLTTLLSRQSSSSTFFSTTFSSLLKWTEQSLIHSFLLCVPRVLSLYINCNAYHDEIGLLVSVCLHWRVRQRI